MLELEDLLAPISDVSPCGEDMSFSAEFDAILDARRADDPSLAQGEWVSDLKYADWSSASKDCSALLRNRSKDLRLAVWLTEAETQSDGFAALALGYRLVAGLCDRYWDELHPRIEDGDVEERVGNMSWLLTHSAQWLRKLPLTSAAQGAYGIADFEAARTRATDGSADGQPTPERLDAARRDTPHEFYQQLMTDVPDCVEALAALQQSIDRRLGQDGPSFTALRDQLVHLQATAARFARDAGIVTDGIEPAPEIVGAPVTEPQARHAGPRSLDSRKAALAQLRDVADFFRRTEPHSPVAYLADKAARWGEMPLHVWLKRVIKDDVALSHIEELLDIGDPQGQRAESAAE